MWTDPFRKASVHLFLCNVHPGDHFEVRSFMPVAIAKVQIQLSVVLFHMATSQVKDC